MAKLKEDVAALNQELFSLEEDILYPANTQIAVFLSVETGGYFALDSVELRVDGRMASSHLYSEQERKALEKGGIQRLYLGNLSSGDHSLTAVLNGQGVNDHYFRKERSFTVRKSNGAEKVELVIEAKEPTFEPSFELNRWN
ncbi:AraC family transcriptional regulator [Marinobacteraceae bacterium S3BR75-40.1]